MKKSFEDSLRALKEVVKFSGSNSNTNGNQVLIEDFLIDIIDETSSDYNPLFGREEELNRLIQIILRKQKSNPILVGEAGVGKMYLLVDLHIVLKL